MDVNNFGIIFSAGWHDPIRSSGCWLLAGALRWAKDGF
jgi:hypothetical protein